MDDEVNLTPVETREWSRLEAQLRTQQDADRAIAVAKMREAFTKVATAFVEGWNRGVERHTQQQRRRHPSEQDPHSGDV